MDPQNQISPLLQSLNEDIQVIGSFLKDFSKQVVEDKISEYPVYVAFETVSPLGKPFFDRQQHQLNWNYNASILEEFVDKGVVTREKVEEFMNTFGDPLEKACILVLLPAGASFVFVPYK